MGPLRVALDLVPAGPAARRGREEEAADLAHRVPLQPLLALAHEEHAGGERREERQVPQREALRLHDVSMTDSVGSMSAVLILFNEYTQNHLVRLWTYSVTETNQVPGKCTAAEAGR